MALLRFLNKGGSVSPDQRSWRNDHVLADVKAWRPSQDVPNSPADGTVTHTYLTGYYAIVATDDLNDIFLNASALAFCLDRDACNAGQPFIIKNNIGAVLNDVACSPIFAGSNYPMGGYS